MAYQYKKGLLFSELTGKVYFGKSKQIDGEHSISIGEKIDVTNDFMSIVRRKFSDGKYQINFEDGTPAYTIELKAADGGGNA